jgi:hypothetical protein
MSWSFSAKGKAKEVLERANLEFVAFKCVEPEQTARMSCHSILQNLLPAWPEGVDVDVQMHGSQSTGDAGIVNSLSVKIGQVA